MNIPPRPDQSPASAVAGPIFMARLVNGSQ